MSSDEAKAAIAAAGLAPSAVDQPDADVPAGTVINQAPAAGTKAAAGTAVLYAFSSGKPEPLQ